MDPNAKVDQNAERWQELVKGMTPKAFLARAIWTHLRDSIDYPHEITSTEFTDDALALVEYAARCIRQT